MVICNCFIGAAGLACSLTQLNWKVLAAALFVLGGAALPLPVAAADSPPSLTQQPKRRTVLPGANPSFSVMATGTEPLHYQWTLDGVPLSGATGATLALSNVQLSNAGPYRVILTNAAGAVTSSVATLTVHVPGDPLYALPDGGWAYRYTGNGVAPADLAALDGTWDHNNGSDQWDGLGRGPGNGAVGGVGTAAGILTIEDALNSGTADNRRLYFTHNLAQEASVTNASTLLTDGVTLSFRARLTPPTDPLLELTNAPNGWVNHTDGKGILGLRQSGDGGEIISFSLNNATEDTGPAGTFNFGQAGLHMNNLNGNIRSSFVDPGEGGTTNLLPLDPAVFHEFWITIQDNGADPGTHRVSVYMDGARTSTVFQVTAGTGSEGTGATNYLSMGLGSTAQRGAVDIDFFSYRPGVVAPQFYDDPVGIVAAPAGQLIAAGQTATFQVGVTGAPPYSFQWCKSGAAISNATNASYTTPPGIPADSGTPFTVTICNDFNVITSSPPALLTIAMLPTISAQPQTRTATNGDTFQFSVTASGDGLLSYQWRFNGGGLSGETSSTLTLTNAAPAQAGNYDVIVSNLAGSVTSVVATLTVKVQDFGDAPAPYPTLLAGNGARHLIVPGIQLGTAVDIEPDGQPNGAATGDDLGGSDDEDGVSFLTPLRVGQSASIQVVASIAGFLDAWIDGNHNGSWADAEDRIFNSQPLVAGTNVLNFNLSALALEGGTFARFRFSTAGGLSFDGPAADGEVEDYAVTLVPVTDLRVAKIESANPIAVSSNLVYTLTVTNAGPSPATGVTATDALPAGVTFVSVSASQGSCAQSAGTITCALDGLNNGAVATVTITVVPTATGTLTNSASVTANELDLNLTNNAATVTGTVLNSPLITTHPQSRTVTNGTSVGFNVIATGALPLRYQWRRNGTDLVGETNAPLSINNAQLASAGDYTVLVQNAVGGAISQIAVLTVLAPPSITAPPLGRTNFAGSTAMFGVTLTGTAPLNYQWFFNGTNAITGATNAPLVLTNVTTARSGSYHVVVQNSLGATTSAPAALLVLEVDFGDAPQLPYPTLLASNGAYHVIVPGFRLGARVDFEPDGQPNAAATGDDLNGSNDDDGVTFTSPLLIGQTATVSIVASTNGFLDAWIDFNGNGTWADAGDPIFTSRALVAGTNALTLTVPASAVAGTTFARFRFSSAGALSFDGPASNGEVEDYSVAISPAVDLAIAKISQPSPIAVGSNLTYTIAVTNLGPSAATDVTLSDLLPVGVTFASAAVSQGSCVHSNGVITCAVGLLDVLSTATITIQATPLVAGTLTNRVSVSALQTDVNLANNSAAAVTVVMTYPVVVFPPQSQTVTNNDTISFTVTAEGSALRYQWRRNGSDLPGGTNSPLILSNVQTNHAGTYSVRVLNDIGEALSGPATLTVLVRPFFIAPPQSLAVTNGDTAVFSVTASGTGLLGYQWLFRGIEISGETGATLTIPNAQAAQDGSYTVRVSSPVDTTLSPPALLTVILPPAITQQPQSRTNNAGSVATFTVAASGTQPFSHHWYFNNTNLLESATNATLVLAGVQTSQAGGYHVVVGNSLGAVTSVVATLTVVEMDFGDAPAPYPTLLINNGARHTLVPGFYLGAGVDFDPDGQPNAAATGDNLAGSNDEDGVTFLNPIFVAHPVLLAVVASTNGLLDGWIDFNGNGDWGDLSDQVFFSQPLQAGTNLLTFAVPADALAGLSYARFRFSSAGNLFFDGPAPDGEVEDYAVTINGIVDLALTGVYVPEPVAVGADQTYTLTVTNYGPSMATGVMLTETSLGPVSLVSLSSSQGSCTNSGGVITCHLGSLAAGASATVSIVAHADQVGGLTNAASVAANGLEANLADNALTNTSAVVVRVGPFVSPGPIAMPGSGAATPYPSTITVSGVTADVYRVTVTLSNLYLRFPADFDILLVGPQGQATLLMSDVGGPFSITNVTLTFDDTASSFLPNFGQIFSGTYKPSDIGTESDGFLPPAPGGAYASSLSVFQRTNPNGVWSLYVQDDFTGDGGFIANGWSLQLLTLDTIADVAVATTASPEPVAATSNLTYTITVTNRGPAGATGVRLADLLPGSANLVSVTPTQGACTNDNGTIRCELGSLAKGASAKVTMVVQPSAAGTATNLASVTATEVDLVTANNSATTLTVVKLDTDLALTQTASPGPVLLQQPLAYTLVITNRGPHAATLVSVRDVLPDGFSVESIAASQGSCSNVGGVVSCDLGSLAVGASVTITLAGRPTVVGPFTNSASVTLDEVERDPFNNAAVLARVVLPAAHLSLSQTDSPDPVPAGQNLTYTLVVTNRGPSVATGVIFTDTLPKSAHLISAVSSRGNCTNIAGTVVCALGTLAVGDEVTVTLVTLTTTPGTITNFAQVTLDQADPNLADNSSTALTGVMPVADLSVIKSSVPDPVAVGQSLVYTLMVTNHGPNRATGVVLGDALPAAVSFVSASTSQGVCTQTNGTVTCDLGALASGATATITITGQPTRGGVVTNIASVSAVEIDLNLANNLGVQITTVVGGATRFGQPASITLPDVGPALTYPSTILVSGLTASVYKVTVTLSNLSHSFPDDLDLLLVGPGGQKVMLMSDVGGGSALNGVTLTFDDAALLALPDAGEIVSGSFRPTDFDPASDGFAPPAPTGPYGTALSVFNGTNPDGVWSLFIVDDEAQDGGVLGGGWSLSITTLAPIADLAVTKIALPDPVALNSNLTFTLTLANRGPAADSDVTVLDTLPAGVIFVSVTSSQGGCSNVSGIVRCALGTLAVGAETTVTIVVVPTVAGKITNTVVVAGNELDLNLANNTARATASVEIPPDITAPPQSQTVANLSPATFTVTVLGTEPLHYQWQRNGSDLADATNRILLLSSATPANRGSYTVRVSNRVGMIQSAAAALAVLAPPDITDIPDQQTNENAPATIPFVVGDFETTAESLTLTAHSSNPALVPDTNIFFGGGGSNRTVTLVPLTNQFGTTTITLIVTDAFGETNSDSFVLTVTRTIFAPPLITRVTRTGATTHISFTTEPGGSYTVEFKNELTDASWSALSPVPGTGSERTVDDVTAGPPRRYYRVRAQ